MPGVVIALVLIAVVIWWTRRSEASATKAGKQVQALAGAGMKGAQAAIKYRKPILLYLILPVVAIALVWWWTSRPEKFDRCARAELPGPHDIMPIGHWCFEVKEGQTLYIKPTVRVEIVSEMPKVRFELFDPDGKKYDNMTKVYGHTECYPLSAVPWGKIYLTPVESGGTIRVRVGNHPQQMVRYC